MTDELEDGFALPLALFFMAILTMMITAAFSKVASDRRVADSSGAAVQALAVAQSGLHTFIGTQTSRPSDGDSTRVNVSGGYADVIVKILHKPVSCSCAADTLLSELFVVRSTGHVIDPTQGSDPQASRTVAQFAQWQTAHIGTFPAVYTASNGLNSYSGSGTDSIVGADSTSCSTVLGTNGLRVRNNSPNTGNAPPTRVPGGFTGSIDGSGAGTVADLVGVGWYNLTTSGFVADYTTLTNLSSWSTYYINGNATLSSSGNGLLMVTGNLTITGATTNWSGIILVGQSIIWSATSTTVRGLVASGLINQTGFSGNYNTKDTFGTTGKTARVEYNSCDVRKALASFNGFSAVGNAVVDNWKTY